MLVVGSFTPVSNAAVAAIDIDKTNILAAGVTIAVIVVAGIEVVAKTTFVATVVTEAACVDVVAKA